MASNNLVMNDEDFGVILPFIKDDAITDINYNGRALWIDHQQKGRYEVKESGITDNWIAQFVQKLSNKMNVQCNKSQPYLEAETDQLRISIIHEAVTNTGYSISIRKTPPVRRITYESIIKDNYCDNSMEAFLGNAVKAHFNIVVCGIPGTGKTELVKYLTKYIPRYEKVITIEDNYEIRYSSINPTKDSVEIKVNDLMTYDQAIKLSMRQLPKWILIAETRGQEVVELLKSLSTGTNCLTTLHTDSVRKVPERIRNMNVDMVNINDVYMFIDIAVQVKSVVKEGEGIHRFISELALIYHDIDTGKNEVIMLYDNGKYVCDMNKLPEDVMIKFREAGFDNPFVKYEDDNDDTMVLNEKNDGENENPENNEEEYSSLINQDNDTESITK